MKWFDGITDLQESLKTVKECAAEYFLKADEPTRQKMLDAFSAIKLAFQAPKLLFKKLSKENHPDKGGSEEVMKEINVEFGAFKAILSKATSYIDNPAAAVDKTAEKVRKQIMKSINIQYAESQILFDENKKAAEKVRKQREHYHSTKSEYQSEPDYDFTSDFWNSYEETDDKKSDFWNVDFKSAVKNSLDFLIGLFEEINKTDPVKLKTARQTHTKGSRYRRGKIRRGAVWRT